MASETVPADALDALDTTITEMIGDYDMYAYVSASQGILQVELYFNSFTAFFDWNKVPEIERPVGVNRTITESAFFVDRELSFENPWVLLERLDEEHDTRARINAIEARARELFTFASANYKQYFFVFESTTRRSSVPSAYRHDNLIVFHSYFFRGNTIGYDTAPPYIVIIDRFANQPLWYGLGLIATAIFMGIVLVILKTRQKKAPSIEG